MSFYRKQVHLSDEKSWHKKIVSYLKQFFTLAALRTWFGIGVVAFSILLFVFTIFAVWVSRDLPNPDALSHRTVAQSTKIYDRSGEHLLYEIHGDEKRTLIKIQDIPDMAKYATIAIEDKKFYEHHGIYWKGLVRALLQSALQGKRLQGTSTLTQQLVKNAILNNQRSLMRKMREFILALQLERHYTKDQILQLYFNEIPYGSTIYGIESAAQTYFGKPTKELTLDEAALLAAIPQAPDLYSPYGTGTRGDNRTRLVGRQHYILTLMEQQGYITHEQATIATATDTLKKIKPRKIGDISAPHFVMYVRSLLVDAYGTQLVEQGGLRVITTLDWDKQQAAEAAVKKGVVTNGKRYGFTNAALVSLDPKTGQILAMVGSHDFFDHEHDGQVNVTTRPRQPGSSFKPIVYAAGFMKGFLPETHLWDVDTVFKTDGRDYHPRNYDLKEHGPVSIRTALQGSLNIPAVKMLYLVGVGRLLDFAETLGYTTLRDRSRFGLSLVLGGGEVKPVEHAAAYAAFANDGRALPTAAVLNIQQSDGETLEEWKQPEGKRVFDPQIARMMSQVLSDNSARAYIFGAKNFLTLPDRSVAAKTGTTNDYHDAWTIGYTPNLVAVVWVGNNDNAEMKRGADGSVVAAPIWQQYMRAATKNLRIESFTHPADPTDTTPVLLGHVTQRLIKIDRQSNKRATEYTPADLIDEKPFYEAHSILYYLDKNDPTGPPPTNPAHDPQFTNWETAVQSWVQRTGWHTTETAPILYDDLHTPQNKPQVTILSPEANQTIQQPSVSMALTTASTYPIARYEVLVAGQPARITLGTANQITFDIPSLVANGFQEVTLAAIDTFGNRGEATVTINLSLPLSDGPSQGGITILDPAPEAIWSRATFPREMTVSLTRPERFQEVEVAFLGNDGERRVVNRLSPEGMSTLRIHLALAPPIGRYALIISGRDQNGGDRQEQARTYLTITAE